MTKARFRRFVEDMPVDDRKLFILIRSIDEVRGREFLGVVRIGAYWNVNDHEKIYDDVLTRVRY